MKNKYALDLFHSLFRGMKSGDDLISTVKDNSSNSVEIIQNVTKGGVLNDFLQEKETEQVKEMRDAYYKIFRESDKYLTDLKWCDKGDLSATIKKKDNNFYNKHIPVFQKQGDEIILIQDNKSISKYSLDEFEKFLSSYKGLYDFDTTLNIYRDGYTSRFLIEKFIKKIVLRKTNEGIKIDLYASIYASQFGKIDAIFISELNRLLNKQTTKLDFLSFDKLSFVTDKAWNSENLKLYEFSHIQFEEINVFDGNFVLTYSGKAEHFDFDIVSKYKNQNLEYKYQNILPKKETTDIFAIERRNNILNEKKI